jgi:hypothetical protein
MVSFNRDVRVTPIHSINAVRKNGQAHPKIYLAPY